MWRPVSEDTKLWFMALYGRSEQLHALAVDDELTIELAKRLLPSRGRR